MSLRTCDLCYYFKFPLEGDPCLKCYGHQERPNWSPFLKKLKLHTLAERTDKAKDLLKQAIELLELEDLK